VALIDKKEPRHAECVKIIRELSGNILTVWPVLTEAAHFLEDFPGGLDAILGMVEARVLGLAALDCDDVPRILELMGKYRDHPMDLADAALVRVAEREHITRVFTLDRRDFSVYRAGRWGRFTLIP